MTLTAATIAPDGAPIEEFWISGSPGSIAIRATTPSALTQAAGWYLKYVARADLMLRGRNPRLPTLLPAPDTVIHRSAAVPHRYAFNDTNDSYTDPHLAWEDWENQLDLMALHGINAVHVTVGTDYVYYQLMQKYGYTAEEVRRWIPDAAHQPWWVLQNMSGGDFPITEQLLIRRAQLGRRIADRARELGITPVLPGYWGTVPTDFAARNPDADVVAQDTWVGYQRPGWLNPVTPLFRQVAADYYALSGQVLGESTMYKMDPLHEGGLVGHLDLAQSAAAIETALQVARPGATWVLLAWMNNPSPALLAGVRDKSRLLLLASEADRHPTWDSTEGWRGVPYALGSIYNFGGRTILGANATTMVDRWFSDRDGLNSARLRGVAIFPESWTTNPAAAELLTELPWHSDRFDLGDWLRSYSVGRYGVVDAHALNAWTILASTAYATPPDSESDAHDSLFNAQPSLTASATLSWAYGRMRYSGPDLEKAWRELLAAAPAITQGAAYQFDLTDLTRQVIVNRARVLLPLIRRAYDTMNHAEFATLTDRWRFLMDLADRVEGTNSAFMLGPHLENAKANGATPAEQMQLARNAVNLITNWGNRSAFSIVRDYANRDWNCLTGTYYKPRWTLFFDSLKRQMAGERTEPIDWYKFGDDFANADHSACALAPTGDIVQLAREVQAALDDGPDASKVPDGWSSYSENDAIFDYDSGSYRISSAGADIWGNINRFGVLYQPVALRDGGSATVRVASMLSEGNRPWGRAGIMAGSNLVSTRPGGFVNIAVTPGHGCVFSWAKHSVAGLQHYTALHAAVAPQWLRLSRIGDTYVAACSRDGIDWAVVGSAVPGDFGQAADVGMFASAANAGGSDRLVAKFDHWSLAPGNGSGDKRIAIEYFHAGFAHHFVTELTDETAKLDAGVFEGWTRTGHAFNVYASGGAGRVAVCRFFTTAFPPTSSHFYAPRGLGCEGALANEDWQFEGDVFYTHLPDPDGTCRAGTIPVYRMYNNGRGGAPNHRYTASLGIRGEMIAAGYIPEGAGIGVGMCSPQ